MAPVLRLKCPTCDGVGLIADLGIIDPDESYSRGNLRGVRQSGSEGEPKMQCKTCKGQGWITDDVVPNQFDMQQFNLDQFA